MRFAVIMIISLSCQYLLADYSIEGKVNTEGPWQGQIFLSTIDNLDDYYSAKPEHIIAVAPVNTDGSFIINGDNLPEFDQFYRLYMIKESDSEYSACLYQGQDDQNFLHLVLNNNSKLTIVSDGVSFAPFGDYTIEGSFVNEEMRKLDRILLPRHKFYEIRYSSELTFAQNKINKDLFSFADTCAFVLPALAALINTDFDNYFDTQYEKYKKMEGRLSSEMISHPYQENYKRKLRYYGDTQVSMWTILFALSSLFLLVSTIYFWLKSRSLPLESKFLDQMQILSTLTQQEQKIFEFIIAGNSNKEIASMMFIELSTVKSHINKLYSKLKVSNRKEVIEKYKSNV